MNFNPPSGNTYKPPPLSSKNNSKVRAVSGIIPNSGGLMFALPTYEEAGEDTPKLNRNRQQKTSAPRASFTKSRSGNGNSSGSAIENLLGLLGKMGGPKVEWHHIPHLDGGGCSLAAVGTQDGARARELWDRHLGC